MSELRTLLDDGAAVAGVDPTTGAALAPAPEPSPTVLRVDRWTRRTGARLASEWAEAGVEGVSPDDVDLAADTVETLLASKPTLAERPASPQRARWWQQLMETPECGALRARTVCAPAVAEIAAAEIAKQWVAYAAAHPEPTPDGQPGDGTPGDGESPEQSVARIRSTRAALAEAARAADDAEAAAAGLGLGTSDTTLEATRLAQYTRRLRQSGNLAAIMRMAGRFVARARQLQRQRADLPGLEITGVELSGDLARLLPVESALVAGAVPELELLALARVTERRALSYRRMAREPLAMGPIVVGVDESGSMRGAKIEAAKGLALAMASIARAQRRPFLLYSWALPTSIRVAEGTPDGIVEWCEQFMGAGTTDLRGPLQVLPTTAWPAGRVGARADHLIITDDEVRLSDELLAQYQTWAKATGVRTFGIGVGVRSVATLARVADGGCWAVPSLDLSSPAVEAILSLGPTTADTRAA